VRAASDITTTVKRLRESARSGVMRSEEARRRQLHQLKRMLQEQQARFSEALTSDLGKSALEGYLTEIGFTIAEIDHALAQLASWMKPTRVKLPLTFKPGSAKVVPQPLGSVLVIAPWNYPLQLMLGPVVGALAAGNTVVVKPSELAPATSQAVAELVPQYLDERVVAVVEGGVEETTALLAEPFDHILYTGGGHVAKIVMRAAADHLTPVTLELGGKSPAIVASDADIDVTARRIAWGRFTNAGQTCIAPDYVLVTADVEDRFLGALLRSVHDFYGENPKSSADYGRIVNQRHFDRLAGMLEAGGYEAVVTGGVGNRDERYLAPTVLAGVDPTAAVMQDEIFGPILPVVCVKDLDDAVNFVNDRPHPLALYVFTKDTGTAERIVERTSSGAVSVNHVLLHAAVPDLPFGGVGASGMGAYHGRRGFDTFSHRRSVLIKPTKPDPSLMYPPYKRWKERLLRRIR
jgi:aldehyde dehydrogenase (NAD+)